MEKGLYLVAYPKDNSPCLWKNDKFFSEETIKKHIEAREKGEPESEIEPELILPIFNEALLALQYIKANNVEEAQVCQISAQDAWSYYLDIAEKSGATKAALNLCIDHVPHECSMLPYSLESIKDFEKLESSLKIAMYCGHGYDTNQH